MTCAHCSVESGPQHKNQPSLEMMRKRVEEAAASGIRTVLFTGGEPMLREKEVLELLRVTRRLGLNATMSSNGFWGKNPVQAQRKLGALRKAGLNALTISYDRYHANFQGPEPALNVARAAAALQFPLNINITRAAGDADLQEIVAPFENDAIVKRHVNLRFYDVQPVGRARGFDEADLRSEIEGFCNACSVPALTEDGRLIACNGPAYFAPSGSPLQVGSLQEHSLDELLDKHGHDPVLDTIRTFGPSRLRDELLQIEGFQDFPLRERYAGMCQLCAHITSDAKAVAALRERLGEERFVAERAAKKRIVNAERRGGALSFFTVNSSARARIFLAAANGQPWPRETPQVLGRADFDWKAASEYFASCGLARPLLARLGDAELLRWAPPFFIEKLEQRATRDALRELVIREILQRLDEALQEIGANGVLLKGAALQARAGQGAAASTPAQTPRSLGDVDLYVAPQFAAPLRELLLQRGFHGDASALRTGAHHLAPVRFRKVPVEIHTRLMPAFWRLPEDEMLARSTPLPAFKCLRTLDAAGSLLHVTTHLSSHLFSQGLKTAWDIAQWLQSDDVVNTKQLAEWAQSLAAPRAFWTPFQVVCHAMELPVGSDILALAPRDERQAQLDLVARRRAFSVFKGMDELNPFTKNAFFCLLHDSPVARAQFLGALLSRDAAQARRAAWHKAAEETSTRPMAQLTFQARQAWLQWRDYRRAITCPEFRAEVSAGLAESTP